MTGNLFDGVPPDDDEPDGPEPGDGDECPPLFVAGSETSEQAADEVEVLRSKLRAEVYAFLLARGADGATDQEIQRELPMDENTERPRRVELVRAKLVAKSGRKRPAPSGRPATVWVANPKETTGAQA